MPSSPLRGLGASGLGGEALPGAVHHGAQAVGNEQHRALGEPALQSGLHLELRPRVHGGRGLVQDEDLGFPEKGAGQTQQLLLAQAGREGDSQARCSCVCTSGCAGHAPKGVSTTATGVVGPPSTELVGIPILPFFLTRVTRRSHPNPPCLSSPGRRGK